MCTSPGLPKMGSTVYLLGPHMIALDVIPESQTVCRQTNNYIFSPTNFKMTSVEVDFNRYSQRKKVKAWGAFDSHPAIFISYTDGAWSRVNFKMVSIQNDGFTLFDIFFDFPVNTTVGYPRIRLLPFDNFGYFLECGINSGIFWNIGSPFWWELGTWNLEKAHKFMLCVPQRHIKFLSTLNIIIPYYNRYRAPDVIRFAAPNNTTSCQLISDLWNERPVRLLK